MTRIEIVKHFKEIDKKLTKYNLIYVKFKWQWLFVMSAIIITFPIVIYFLVLLLLSIVEKSVPFSIIDTVIFSFSIVCIYLCVLYLEKQTRYYGNGVAIDELRKKYVILHICEKRLLDKQSLPFIISILREEFTDKYSYRLSLGMVTLLISILLGCLLTGVISYCPDFNCFVKFLIYCVILGIVVVLFWSFVDYFIIKEFIIYFNHRKYRLIRVLEDIHLENITQ